MGGPIASLPGVSLLGGTLAPILPTIGLPVALTGRPQATEFGPMHGYEGSFMDQASDRAGFTALELILVVVVIGVLGAMFLPQISTLTSKNSVGKAANIVQADLEQAFTLAARLRKPVILTADNGAHIYQVADQVGSTVRLTRRLKFGQEYGVETMTFSSASITIQPNGVASDSLGVTLTSRGSTRVISMTRVGLIRRVQ